MRFDELMRHRYTRPVGMSLIMHGVFLALAMFIHVYGVDAHPPEEEMLNFMVRGVNASPVLVRRDSPAINPDRVRDSIRFIKNQGTTVAEPPKDVSVRDLVEEPSIPRPSSADVAPKRMDLHSPDADEGSDLSAILIHAEEEQTRETVKVTRQQTSKTANVFQMIQAHKTDAGQLLQSLSSPLKKLGLGTYGNLDVDPDEGMPGFTPMEGTFGNSDRDQGTGESRGDILRYESLDEFLDIQVFTYQDPADKEKYFMIKVVANKDAKHFTVMPKEILFTIDCSLSISPERLDEFKRGIGYCLRNLNKDDVFNVIAFKDKAIFFSEKSIAATPESIKNAERFVSELTSNRTTDVYGAFEKIVKSRPARVPSNVILISDGRPTHGVVNSRDLISSISKINNKVRPIFAFSGGAKVNRYLLDFISYQNRAWSQFIKERGKIHKGLGDFYAKIKDPIFLNLRHQLNGLNDQDVFPKSLPDFYRNAEFTLYGKYRDENEFSMQLLGDVGGDTKELIFTRILEQAPKGGPEIMKGYAFNKIYHLISRITTDGQKPELLKQIQELSARYKVTTPYSTDLEIAD